MKKVEKTDAQWRDTLGDLAYRVTRGHATERPFTDHGFSGDAGKFLCTCCGAELFDQSAKYDSGSGWPSFYETSAPENIGEKTDKSLGMERTEVHCNQCSAHLGHLFPDGPNPTGLRYCINGVALDFAPEGDENA